MHKIGGLLVIDEVWLHQLFCSGKIHKRVCIHLREGNHKFGFYMPERLAGSIELNEQLLLRPLVLLNNDIICTCRAVVELLPYNALIVYIYKRVLYIILHLLREGIFELVLLKVQNLYCRNGIILLKI